MDMTSLSSEQLVELALRDDTEFKRVGAELEMRLPDEAATRRVEERYRQGLAPGWLAAYLLGRAGHACGLPLLNELVHSGRQTTLSYAATALVRVDAGTDCRRIETLLFGAPKLMVREAAARALVTADARNFVELVVRAAAEKKILPGTASHCLRDADIAPEELRKCSSRKRSTWSDSAPHWCCGGPSARRQMLTCERRCWRCWRIPITACDRRRE